MEGRGRAKGNPRQHTASRAQDRIDALSALARVRQVAERDKQVRFTTPLHHVYHVDHLRAAYLALKREAAPGVDGETWQHYGAALEENLRDLSGRLARGAYRAKPVRRAYIPKADGGQRPLGVPTLRGGPMATDCIAQLTFRYQGLRTPIVARFDVPHASSDGGLVLLKAVDERLRLTEAVARCLTDSRQPGKVAHSMLDLVRQRVFGLAAGYLDGNDAARLADDPLHKLVLDREPLTGPALGSQPTLSRFENGLSRRDLVRVGQDLAQTVIAHHRRRLHGRARRITIDLDPTDDPTHGQQELSFFNGH
jgi:hypothetical protein